MHQVICPNCQKVREVNAKKQWMKGVPPYPMICKACCQLGKPKSEATRKKLSESIKAIQTPELLEKKRQYMLDHPEFWKGKLKEGGAEEHCLGLTHTEETKKKISDSVRKVKGGNK